MSSTMAPEERNGTEEQTVIGRATTVVADVGARVHTAAVDAIAADHEPAALAASRGVIARALAALRRSSSGSLT